MHPVSHHIQVTPGEPSAMTSSSVDMGIDYSLLMLSHVQEKSKISIALIQVNQ